MSKTLAQELGKRNPDAVVEVKKRSNLALIDEKTSVGVEIEMENMQTNYIQRANVDCWERKSDGSLRGSSREFVFSQPLRGDSVIAALETLEDAFEDKQFVKHKNLRTSMHVHVNMLGMSKTQLLAIMISGILTDAAIFGMTEDNREYLGYSKRSEEMLISGIADLHRFKEEPESFPLRRDGGRYFSVNTSALTKYGTIEFRHFATPDNVQEAVKNINACLKVKQCGLAAWEQAGTEETRYDLETMYHLVKEQVIAAFGNEHEMLPIEEFLSMVDEQKVYNEYSPSTTVLTDDIIGTHEEVTQREQTQTEQTVQPEYYDRDTLELQMLVDELESPTNNRSRNERNAMTAELLRRLSVAREPILLTPQLWAELRISPYYLTGMLNNHITYYTPTENEQTHTYYRIVDNFVDQNITGREEVLAIALNEMQRARQPLQRNFSESQQNNEPLF